MAVFRVDKTQDFTIVSNHHLRNIELSLKAKGLHTLMLSLPENWDYTTRGLAHICKDGVDSISSALNELEQNGYLTRKRLRDAKGRLGDIEYTIHEQPIHPETAAFSQKRENPVLDRHNQHLPEQENPVLANPELDCPEQEKHAQLSTITNQGLKEINTDVLSIHPSIKPSEIKQRHR